MLGSKIIARDITYLLDIYSSFDSILLDVILAANAYNFDKIVGEFSCTLQLILKFAFWNILP